MVDSPKGRVMANPIEVLPERVREIGEKLDALSASVDARFAQVDARFDEVTAALVEQREYTEFAVGAILREMQDGFSRMSANFGRLERKFDQLTDWILSRRP